MNNNYWLNTPYKIVLSITAWVLIIGLSACDSGKQNTGNVAAAQSEQFADYAKYKRIDIADDLQRDQARASFARKSTLAEVITAQGVLDQTLINAELEEYRRELLINRYFDKYLAATVSDQAIKDYYQSHASEFESQEMHLAHLLLRTSNTMTDAERHAKQQAMQKLYKKLLAGADFATLAKTASEDIASGKKGGDLGWLSQSVIEQQFSKTVLSLKAGEISAPLTTSFGFHIVKIIEGPVLKKQSFEVVKSRLWHQLRNAAKEAEMERLLSLISNN